MGKYQNSRSDVQREIEAFIFDVIKERFNDDTLISNPKLSIGDSDSMYISPDFFSEQNGVIGEIHAHIGKLKGAQPDKISSDILKMLLYEKKQNREYDKYMVVCSHEEYEQLCGKSALATAIREFGVKLLLVELPDDKCRKLKACMGKQNLLNVK